MRHIRQIIITLVWLLPTLGFAYDFEVDGIYYNIHGNEIGVTCKIDTLFNASGEIESVQAIPTYKGDVTIPATVTYNGTSYPVTSLDRYAFYSNPELESVVCSSGIRKIEEFAFFGCSNLHSLYLPDDVVEIGDYAFVECSRLEHVRFPDSITTFGDDIFGGCYSLPVENGIRYAGNYLVEVCDKDAEECMIREGTCYIGYKAFSWSFVREVKLPSSARVVCPLAFECCIGLERFFANENLEVISTSAFAGCDNLKEVYLSDNLTTIGDCAFFLCRLLEYAPLPSSLTELGSCAFYGAGLTNVHIPSGIEVIPTHCFYECKKLTSIAIDEGVSVIGPEAFERAPISSLVLPSSIKRIDIHAFYGCDKLSHVSALSPVPPVTTVSSFAQESSFAPTTTLHVLPGCREAYAQAEGWKEFKNIVEDAEVPTDISHIASPASSTLYDLQGRKIEAKPGKGIYIKDDKKYMMK